MGLPGPSPNWRPPGSRLPATSAWTQSQTPPLGWEALPTPTCLLSGSIFRSCACRSRGLAGPRGLKRAGGQPQRRECESRTQAGPPAPWRPPCTPGWQTPPGAPGPWLTAPPGAPEQCWPASPHPPWAGGCPPAALPPGSIWRLSGMSTPTQREPASVQTPPCCQPHPACPTIGQFALTQQGWTTGSRRRRVASLRLLPGGLPWGLRAGRLQHLLALPRGCLVGHHATCQSWGTWHVCTKTRVPGWFSAVRVGSGGQVRGISTSSRALLLWPESQVGGTCAAGVQPPFTPSLPPLEKRKLRAQGASRLYGHAHGAVSCVPQAQAGLPEHPSGLSRCSQ